MKKLLFEEIKSQRLNIDQLNQEERFPIYSVLDNVRSMYNVGSVFRTSDATRIEKLVLSGMTAYPPRKEIEKTALGSVESVPWEYYKDSVEAVTSLKSQGIRIVAVEHTDQSIDYRHLDVSFPIALVFGHEVNGVKDEIIALADHAIEVPMYGVKQSLNLSVAYGIVVYQFVFQYLEQKKAIQPDVT